MITQNIYYVGVNDHDVDLFEGQYVVENGMAYNSYVIMDEKIAIMDAVEKNFSSEWIANIESVLNGRKPDYLIIQHMEPDHSSGIKALLNEFPDTIVVASAKAFDIMKQFEGVDIWNQNMVVKEGDVLGLGNHELQFIMAPMVHWPEVMFTYDRAAKVLFSADAFGKFGALDVEEDWACEARRYYFGIVGKYGMQVQMALKKLGAYEIETICPLHGPVLTDNLSYYLKLYQVWSGYEVETAGVMIAYTSVYGHTKEAVSILEQKLLEKGCPKVVVNDLARCDMAEAVEDAFRYGKMVLATTTYNMEIFPYMREFLLTLSEHGYRNRTIGLIENGSWAPAAAKGMMKLLENCKEITFLDTKVSILSALSDENRGQLDAMADELLK